MNKIISAEDEFCRFVNRRLTCKLIRLHDLGYELDFTVLKGRSLACVQEQQYFSEESITVRVVDQAYDFITNSYKYLHTVDTACGKKGILLMEGIYGYHSRFNPVTVPFPAAIALTALQA